MNLSPTPLRREKGLNIFNYQGKIKPLKPLSLEGRGMEAGFFSAVELMLTKDL